MTVHRFHFPGVEPGLVELPEAARAHATRVLRLTEGDPLSVFDHGAEFAARIATIEKRRVVIEVGEALPTRPERAHALHLIMSPLKGDLTELVIQKATELGVAHISPAIFERTDTVARRETSEARLERWRKIAVSASEQSGRSTVPVVDTAVALGLALGALGPSQSDELRIVAAEPSLDVDPGEAKAGMDVADVRSIVVAVGPAGGLATTDLALLRGAGFTSERFAIHTLRSETACIAAVAILGDRFK
jgi:16S rRNA (uracil1498-N3)-methyltransferase